MSGKFEDTFKIIVPNNPNTAYDDILDGNFVEKEVFICGEIIHFWIRVNLSTVSYTINYDAVKFKCKIFIKEYHDNEEKHISTNQLNILEDNKVDLFRKTDTNDTILRTGSKNTNDNILLFAQTVQLPYNQIKKAELKVYIDETSNVVCNKEIEVSTPIKYTTSFNSISNYIDICFNFECQRDIIITDFNLVLKPELLSNNEYNRAFSLRKNSENKSYSLIIASSEAIRLISKLKFLLSVYWEIPHVNANIQKFVSYFEVNSPYKDPKLGIIWNIPMLRKSKQANLSVSIINTEEYALSIELEMPERPLISLLNEITALINPGERKTIDVPCVPYVSGIFELDYKIKIEKQCYRPLLQTVIEILD